MKVRIYEIIVGERRREDMGNIQELADSIKKYGLLHPIVIDDQNRLVAGGRRLEAVKLLGWEEIEARSLGELTERELRVIELEENLRRKDLTEYEKSKNMVELAELKIQEIRNNPIEFLPTLGKNPLGGRPRKIDSQETVAKEIGIPRQTLQDAYVHVKAVDEYPELKPLPKTHAIQIARQLNSLPEHERNRALRELQEIQETGQRTLKQIDDTYKVKKVFDDALYGVSTLSINDERLNMWLSDLNTTEMQRKWELVEEGINNLMILKEYFKKIFGGPRIVKIGGEKR